MQSDQRVLDRGQDATRSSPFQEIANDVLDAGHDPIERCDHVVGIVEGSVEPDVHLRAGEQAEAAFALFQARTSSIRSPEALAGDVVTEAVARRVVGDREVGVAALARRVPPSLRGCCAHRRGVWGVHVAADVGDLDQVGELAFARTPSARLDPRAAPARCSRSRAARRPPPRWCRARPRRSRSR